MITELLRSKNNIVKMSSYLEATENITYSKYAPKDDSDLIFKITSNQKKIEFEVNFAESQTFKEIELNYSIKNYRVRYLIETSLDGFNWYQLPWKKDGEYFYKLLDTETVSANRTKVRGTKILKYHSILDLNNFEIVENNSDEYINILNSNYIYKFNNPYKPNLDDFIYLYDNLSFVYLKITFLPLASKPYRSDLINENIRNFLTFIPASENTPFELNDIKIFGNIEYDYDIHIFSELSRDFFNSKVWEDNTLIPNTAFSVFKLWEEKRITEDDLINRNTKFDILEFKKAGIGKARIGLPIDPSLIDVTPVFTIGDL